ncbi:DUF2894 domain-containing protein [Acidovorax sp. FJL06]|uniref:DUF2894 domain-containing protein n=1 Tax=Acidovorax sp. FJL06 TaxID=2153365 RepID=UPI001F19A817|nr:DUF2894 domain-containing protein [Acidovorax sp. FJL06]
MQPTISKSDSLLETLRAEGAHHHDPVRFHYLEVLAQRLPGQPAAVQQVLAGRLHMALATYARQAQQAQQAPSPHLTTSASDALHRAAAPQPAPPSATGSPLARLNHALRTRAQAETATPHGGSGSGDTSLPEMKSVRQFGEVWSKISAEQQVVQALHRGPENAGPLNAHKLMLRTLSLMRTLSPDYLRRFMSQVDTLLWLEQAGTRAPGPAARPARKGRQRP